MQLESISGSLVKVSWTSNTSANASTQIELRTADGGSGEQWIAVAMAAAGVTAADVARTFSPSTTYQFRVRSYVTSTTSEAVQQAVTTGAYLTSYPVRSNPPVRHDR